MENIEEKFRIIEQEILSSLFRNLDKHIRDEIETGMSYQIWQEQQLLSLTAFSKRNLENYTPIFNDINKDIEDYVLAAYKKGEAKTRLEIINAGIESKNTPAMTFMFNKLNEEKLQVLIKEIVDDFRKAESSVLRNVDDEYRRIISTSQLYLNSGAGNLREAIDLSTKSFLSRGIGAIQYSNGNIVGISAYSNMALRTADTRANLIAAGKVRDEYGLNLVYVHSRGVACPKCLQFINKVYNDDVYSVNTNFDERYPKLSQAISGGLYHPNCKDSHSTYYRDLELPKDLDDLSKLEAKRIYNLQQEQRYNERNIRKFKRLEDGSLYEPNKNKYKILKSKWQERQRELINNNDELKRDFFREKINYI